ncbi:PAS domain S-box protein [Pseudanabaena mucicola]|uniref:histidine kinase n=1 Tax=Pseudanabaena mucicola FACHB-723 TaxID=2692860 RepID=A0ABR8A0X0_9CYAN|nr:PAS domain S-box protein [Pseudanabaena mucicola]MBD2189268.1 PAS domain S-box protein [Pseudanabaena mucicola FACHB-723]
MYSNRGEIPIEQAIIRQPLTITADATVADAIALMSAERQACNLFCDIDSATTLQLDHAKNSCIIVTEDQKLIGILTEYDLIKLCGNSTQSVEPSENTPQNSIQNLLETSIVEVMTYPVRALLEWEFTDILVPLNRFNRYKIRHLPLVNDHNELVGLITHESLRQLLRPIDLLRLRVVSEVMTTDVVYAKPETSAAQIAHLMSYHNVSSVVIVEQQGQKILPVGILTEGDIVQYLALGLDLMTTSAQTVMSFLPTQVRPEETLWTVREIMQTQMVNHLVITDQHGQMQGVISQGDLLKTLQPDEVYQLVSILETKISQLEQENSALLKSRNQLLERQVQEYPSALINGDMFRQFADNNRSAIIIREVQTGKVLYVSPRYEEIWGQSSKGIYQDPQSWMQSIHPEDRDRILEAYKHTVHSGFFSEEYRIIRPDGEIRWVGGRCFPLNNAQGKVEQIAAVAEDISDRKRQDALLAGQSQILELLANDAELSDILTLLAQIVESQASHIHCSVLLLEGNRLFHQAAPSLPEQYIQAVNGVEIGEGVVSCGTAAYRKEAVIVTDIYNDPLWHNYRDMAISLGLCACWSSPIFTKSGNHVLGTLAVYYQEMRQPNHSEVELVNFAVNLASLAIEKKQAENALRESERQQQTLIKALPDLVMRMSGDGIYLDFFPPDTFDVFDNAEIIGQNIYSTTYPINLARTRMEYIRKALETGESQIYEQELTINGHFHIEEVRIAVCAENEVLIIVRDMSARTLAERALKQSEQKLSASESLLSAMFNQSPIGMVITDANGQFIRTNPYYQQMVGYSESELELMTFRDRTLEDDLAENLRLRELVMQNVHDSYQIEKRLVNRDGEVIWVRSTSSKISDESIKSPLFVGVIENINARKQAEESLQSLVEGTAAHTGANFLPTLVEYIAKALEVRHVFVTKVVGDTLEISISWSDGQLGNPSIIPIHNTPCSITVTEGKLFCPANLLEQFADNEMIRNLGAISYMGIAIVNSQGEATGSLCIFDDKPITKSQRATAILQVFAARVSAEIERQEAITALYQLNQKLESRVEQRTQELLLANQQLISVNTDLARATKLKDEFLANMSHELRTPLNAVLGMAEGLMTKVFGELNERQMRSLSIIESSGKHLLELINDILDVAKIGSGNLELDIQPVDVKYLCQSSLSFVKQTALKKNIQLQVVIQPEVTAINVDERRMRQSLINLLSNAVKFTPNNGKVDLEVKLETIDESTNESAIALSQKLIFAITDTGIGISPEDLDKLFQPFVQIDSSLSRQYAGTGLGLTLVKKITELHGGSIDVSSQVGEGSCFSISVPYIGAAEFKKSNLPSPEHNTSSDHLNNGNRDEHSQIDVNSLILLADDNPFNVETFSSYLISQGYRLIMAANGQEAIELIFTHKPDLVIMDVQMPIMDGLTAIREIRANPDIADIPIVVLTALAMVGDRENCLAVGADEYLSKPVQLSHLGSVIQEQLRRRENCRAK